MQKSRKKFWIVFTSVIAGVALLILSFGLITKLKTVTVELRTRASAEHTMLEDGILDKVKSSGEFNYKKSVLFMNFEDNIENIEKSNPYIKVEQVVRHFPNVVKVYVSERIPKFRVRDTQNVDKWYILDADFKVLDMVTGGEAEIKEQNYGRSSSFYDVTIMVSPESWTVNAYIGSFVSNQGVKTNLNEVTAGMFSAIGDLKLIKSIVFGQNQFTITMKNSGINNDDGCEILLNGADDLRKNALAGAKVYVAAVDSNQATDLSDKVITISKQDGEYLGIMSDKETA